MRIHPNDSIQQVQERFQSLFPLLQLRFYRVGHQPGETSSQRDEIVDSAQQLVAINPNLETSKIPINEQTTAGELEMEFARLLGL